MANKTKITINPFNISSIEQAIADINLYERKFEQKLDLFCRRLAEYGVEVAKNKVLSYDAVFTAELLNSVHLEKKSDCIYAVVSDSKHTAFVEFGTGQLGSVRPYKKGLFADKGSWEYNIGEHIQYAEENLVWGDKTIPKGTYYWFYFDVKLGHWCLTQGMPSRPFMSDTAIDMSKLTTIRKIAKEVFNA